MVASTATTCRFSDRSTAAGCLNTPFLAYSIFAAVLNWRIAADNPDADRLDGDDPAHGQPSSSSHQGPTSVTTYESVQESVSVSAEYSTEYRRVAPDEEESRKLN